MTYPEDSDRDREEERPRPTTPSPPDEEESDPGDLSNELPPDEDGDLLDDRPQNETLSPTELGIEGEGEEDGWTKDSEGDENGSPEDVGDLGSEYGWTSDVEEPGTDDWDEDLDTGLPESGSALDDPGDEGTGEETDLGALTFEPLEHEEEDDGESSSDEEGVGASGEDRAQLPPKHEESEILLRSVGPHEGILATIVARGRVGMLAGGVGLYSADESGILAAVEEGPLEHEEITSIAVDADATDHVFVGTMLAGVFASHDGGRTFAAANGWRALSRRGNASVWVASAGASLVVRTGDGDVARSTDRGDTWARVDLPGRAVAHAATPAGRLAILCTTAAGPCLVLSDDGGATLRTGAARPELRAVAACADVQLGVGPGLVVVGAEDENRGAWASQDDGATFSLWPAAPGVTAIAIHPTAGTCALAVCLPGENRAAVLRTADRGHAFTTLFELGTLRMLLRLDARGDEEGENRVSGLTWTPTSSLLVASSAGGFLVQVRPDASGAPANTAAQTE